MGAEVKSASRVISVRNSGEKIVPLFRIRHRCIPDDWFPASRLANSATEDWIVVRSRNTIVIDIRRISLPVASHNRPSCRQSPVTMLRNILEATDFSFQWCARPEYQRYSPQALCEMAMRLGHANFAASSEDNRSLMRFVNAAIKIFSPRFNVSVRADRRS